MQDHAVPVQPGYHDAVAAVQDLFHLYIGLPVTEADATVFRFTWKLFIVAKARLFLPFPDLVASFNLLICVLAFVYCHVPAAQRAVPLTDETNLPRRSKEGAVDVLQVTAFHFGRSCRCPSEAWQMCRLAGLFFAGEHHTFVNCTASPPGRMLARCRGWVFCLQSGGSCADELVDITQEICPCSPWRL